MQAESSTRELRSRKAVAAVDSSLTSISSKVISRIFFPETKVDGRSPFQGSLNETASALPLPSQSFNRKGVHVKARQSILLIHQSVTIETDSSRSKMQT